MAAFEEGWGDGCGRYLWRREGGWAFGEGVRGWEVTPVELLA
jgi:hypothetical protein